jgi:stage II sporulation protein AA (anti-sigma F factor antagonist)
MATIVTIELLGLENFPSVKVLVFKGQIDESNLQEASTKLDLLVIDNETRYILLNFKGLEFINSKVIGYLASLYSNASEKGKKVMIVEANEGIMDILSLVGLTTIIDHYPTLEEAIEVVKTDIEQ